MQVDLLSKEDLAKFKSELLEEIRLIIKGKSNIQQKEWIKSYEVRKLLSISPGTLQQMRVNGTLAYTQIGGIIYYKHEDITKMMEVNKHKNPFSGRNK